MLRIPTHRIAEHPGALLREQIDEMGLTVERVAAAAGLAPLHLREIVDERRDVSVEAAVALGAYFGQSSEFWMNAQKVYEVSSRRIALMEKGPTVSVRPVGASLKP